MRILTLILGAAILASCATPEDRSVAVQREVDQMVATYGPACERLGYPANDDRWRDCVMRLAQRDEQRYLAYSRFPTTTHCFGHRGFFNCTTF